MNHSYSHSQGNMTAGSGPFAVPAASHTHRQTHPTYKSVSGCVLQPNFFLHFIPKIVLEKPLFSSHGSVKNNSDFSRKQSALESVLTSDWLKTSLTEPLLALPTCFISTFGMPRLHTLQPIRIFTRTPVLFD